MRAGPHADTCAADAVAQAAAPTVGPGDPTQSKAIATLRARASLAGFTLCMMTETDGQCFYMLSRWGMSCSLADLGAVAVFLRQVGAPL